MSELPDSRMNTPTPVAGPSSAPPDNPDRPTKVWTGDIIWKRPGGDVLLVGCNILTEESIKEALKVDAWSDLLLFVLPDDALGCIGRNILEDYEPLLFEMSPSPQLEELTDSFKSGEVGFIRFKSETNGFVVLTYTPETNTFIGIVPNDQMGLVIELANLLEPVHSEFNMLVRRAA